MAAVLCSRILPTNRKRRLLEYLEMEENDNSDSIKKEHQINKEIESVLEKLVADTVGIADIPTVTESPESVIKQLYAHGPTKPKKSKIQTADSSPAEKQKLCQSEKQLSPEEFEKYAERIESIIETANMLNQQLLDVTKEGIIVCEHEDVAYDGVKATENQKESSPVPEKKKRTRKVKKPVKNFVHITADSFPDYFESLPSTQTSTPIITTKSAASKTSKQPEMSSPSSDRFPFTSVSYPDYVVIGPNGTFVSKDVYFNIDWSLSAPIVTRKLLVEIFGREMLSTHSLTGKPSPAFLDMNKPMKKPLNSEKVADIIYIVTKKKNVSAKEVRLTITSKCADEQKMLKNRKSK